jgi:hypothetical protein
VGLPQAREQRLSDAAREVIMNDLASYESIPMEKLRDRVMDDLVKHYSLERVSLEEFERRTDRVSKASTRGELVAQVADLPAIEDEGRGNRARTAEGPERRPSVYSGARESDVAVAIFGGSDFRGVWRAPRKLNSLCLFGGINVDLRKAMIPEEGLTISCACIFGGVDIIAPPGINLVVRGMAIFGGFDRPHNDVDDPSAPTVVVEGIALFGGVSVRIKA